jgi:hypothetical protein
MGRIPYERRRQRINMRLMFLGGVLPYEALGAFTRVENNNTSNPIVIPGRVKVVI